MRLIFIPGASAVEEFFYYQTGYFPDSEVVTLPDSLEGEPITGLEQYARWLDRYIKERGYTDVILMGVSMGGGIALLYALEHPKELKALILGSTGARLRVHPRFIAELEAGARDREARKRSLASAYPSVDPRLREILIQKRVAKVEQELRNFLSADRFDVMDRLHEIKLPTLVLCGSQDEMTPVKYSHYLASKIEGARLRIIEGGTHYMYLEKPGEVNQAIEDFLKSL